MDDKRQETLKEIGTAFARTRPPEPSAEMPAQPTLFDDYSFDKTASWSLDPFTDIIGRHFRQPKEGLGNDASATAHMWRTLIDPSKPL